jgi:hypothetical protein
MKIQVMRGNRAFTYSIDAEVKVGDEVMVPPPFWDPSGAPHKVAVIEIGSDYDGPLTRAWLPPR